MTKLVEAPRRRSGQERRPTVETHINTVGFHDRTWVDHPSGWGFYTLDRTQGDGDTLEVVSYLFNVKDTVNRFVPEDTDPNSAVRVLTDWKYSRLLNRDKVPTGAGVGEGARFFREWSLTVEQGNAVTIETLRGLTPVRMVFQA